MEFQNFYLATFPGLKNHQRNPPPTLVNNGSYHSPEEPVENTSEIRFKPPSRSGDPTNASLVAMGKAAYGQLGQGMEQVAKKSRRKLKGSMFFRISRDGNDMMPYVEKQYSL